MSEQSTPSVSVAIEYFGNGAFHKVTVPLDWYYNVYRVLYWAQQAGATRDDGADAAYALTRLGAAVLLVERPLDQDEQNCLRNVIHDIVQRSKAEKWQVEADILSSCCYWLLRSKQIRSWPEAAAIANDILKPPSPFTPHAWRLRVTRWANHQHPTPLEPVDLRKKD